MMEMESEVVSEKAEKALRNNIKSMFDVNDPVALPHK
jgi:hypothetical protein